MVKVIRFNVVIPRLHRNWVAIGFRYANKKAIKYTNTAPERTENQVGFHMDLQDLSFLNASARGDVRVIREMLEQSNDRDLNHPSLV